MDGILGTDRDAAAAADAQVCFDIRLAVGVHGHLARTRAAAHADVLERAAEARFLMALEVRQ